MNLIKMKTLPASFYRGPTLKLAKDLLGKLLVHKSPEGTTIGRIVETEAYLQGDPACHAFSGPTPRTQIMFGPPGVAYVYFIYGMYWCFNVVSEAKGIGEAVLVRALEPLEGLDLMRQRRNHGRERGSDLFRPSEPQGVRGRSEGIPRYKDLCNGPGKLCAAMGIGKALNGMDLTSNVLYIADAKLKCPKSSIVTATRIGLSKASEHPYRFYFKGNPFVSRQ